jgi:6-pyruvoyl-tetrahydropterin synthase
MIDFEIDDRGDDLFSFFDKSRGISYCIKQLCEPLDFESLNEIKNEIYFVHHNLNMCNVLITEISERKRQITFNEFFSAFKCVFKARNCMDQFTQGISTTETDKSELFENLASASFALFDELHQASTLMEDMIENPTVKKAA